ncbi:MAG: hypothetical protein K2H43_01365, partial [Clostridia bacterium]|nr:hypothetical protein [Clostridia bacterium]
LCFYLTLTLARVTLYLLYRKDAGREEHEYPFLVAVVSALALVGLEVCALALSAYVNGTLITLSNAAVITNTVLAVIANGFLYNTIRFVVKFIVPFTGRRHMKNRSVESEFFRCKKYLSRAESLFMLMLLINRLLARQNPSLTPVQSALHLVVFLAAGAYAIISGMMLFFRANKRKKDETLTENR